MLDVMSKDEIRQAIQARIWIDDTRLTRLMVRKLTEYVYQMPDTPAPERLVLLFYSNLFFYLISLNNCLTIYVLFLVITSRPTQSPSTQFPHLCRHREPASHAKSPMNHLLIFARVCPNQRTQVLLNPSSIQIQAVAARQPLAQHRHQTGLSSLGLMY